MRSPDTAPGRLRMLWLATWMLPVVLQLTLSTALPDWAVFESAIALFWVVLVAASLCVLTSGAVLVRALRRREAELGYTGLFFMAVSMLPLVHGITTPGVLYGENAATMSSVFWSVPIGLLLVAPLVGPSRWRSRVADRLFRPWAAAGMVLLTTLSGLMLALPDLVPAPTPGSAPVVVTAGASILACVRLSRRHLLLAHIARSAAPLAVAAGYGFVGASTLVWLGAAPFSAGFWVAHALDISGVFAGTIGALVVFQRSAGVRPMIEPVLVGDPLAALELGVEPVVHRFVADLEAKDPITRDHVVRTAELAVEIATDLGLDGDDIRAVGLTGLLHDVGKLEVPDEILNKPGALTDEEFATMKEHVLHGERLVQDSPALHRIASSVRGHHERIDGRGYPDGLTGDEIPLVARIISVCDAFDAMANTRQYRSGLGVERALEILRDNAGEQWDAKVVESAVRIIEAKPPAAAPQKLDAIGRSGGPANAVHRIGCDCLPREIEDRLNEAA